MVGDRDEGKREGGGDCPFHFFDHNGFLGENDITGLIAKIYFFNWQNGFSVFEGSFGNRIESEKKN